MGQQSVKERYIHGTTISEREMYSWNNHQLRRSHFLPHTSEWRQKTHFLARREKTGRETDGSHFLRRQKCIFLSYCLRQYWSDLHDIFTRFWDTLGTSLRYRWLAYSIKPLVLLVLLVLVVLGPPQERKSSILARPYLFIFRNSYTGNVMTHNQRIFTVKRPKFGIGP